MVSASGSSGIGGGEGSPANIPAILLPLKLDGICRSDASCTCLRKVAPNTNYREDPSPLGEEPIPVVSCTGVEEEDAFLGCQFCGDGDLVSLPVRSRVP